MSDVPPSWRYTSTLGGISSTSASESKSLSPSGSTSYEGIEVKEWSGGNSELK